MEIFGFKFVNNGIFLSKCKERLVVAISKLLQVNKELFDGKLGKYNYKKRTLIIRPHATPVFYKQRLIPLAL